MGYRVVDDKSDLPSPADVPVGSFARAGSTWYKNGACGRGWVRLDHAPRPYAAVGDDEIFEDDDDEILWEE